DAYSMTGRNRVDAFVGRPVRATAKRQEARDVLLVEIRDSGFFHQILQTVRPLNTSGLHVIVKRTHAGEVACEHGGPVLVIANDEAPIADQLNQTFSAPTIVCGTRNCLTTGFTWQR